MGGNAPDFSDVDQFVQGQKGDSFGDIDDFVAQQAKGAPAPLSTHSPLSGESPVTLNTKRGGSSGVLPPPPTDPSWRDYLGSAFATVTGSEPGAETGLSDTTSQEVSHRLKQVQTPGERTTGALGLASEALEPTTALLGPAAIENPLAIARGMAEGAVASKGAGYVAKKAGANDEQKSLIEDLAFWAPGVARSFASSLGLAEPKVGVQTGPEGTGVGISGSGGTRAGVAVTPEEIRIGGQFKGGPQRSVSIPRGGKAAGPAIEAPTIEGQIVQPPNPVAEAASSMAAQTNAETQAARTVAGVPPPTPPPTPPPIHQVTPEEVSKLAQMITQLPPELRAPAMIETHGTVAKLLTQQGKVIGPNGQLEIIDSPKAADSVAKNWLNAEVQRQDKLAEEAAKTPKAAEKSPVPTKTPAKSAQPVENEITAAKGLPKAPAADFSDVDKFVEKAVQSGNEAVVSTGHNEPGTGEVSGRAASGSETVSGPPKTGREATASAINRIGEGDASKADLTETGAVAERSPGAPSLPSNSPKTGREAFTKGDRVELADGTKAEVIFTHPSQSIVRVKTDDGVKRSVGISKVRSLQTAGPEQPRAQEISKSGERSPGVTAEPGTGTGRKVSSVAAHVPKAASAESEAEPKYKYGSTQANISDDSEAAKGLETARQRISKEDLAGKGSDVGGNHLTVRYGIKGEDHEGIKKYLSSLEPFEAKLGKTDKFPPTEHSDGAAVIHAPIEAPELHSINKELEKHGEFTEPSFDKYRPHATVAYVKPEKADRYVGMSATEGKKFKVNSIAITDRNGNQNEIKLEGKRQEPAGATISKESEAQPTPKGEQAVQPVGAKEPSPVEKPRKLKALTAKEPKSELEKAREALKESYEKLNGGKPYIPLPREVVAGGNTYEYKNGQFYKNGKIAETTEDIVDASDALGSVDRGSFQDKTIEGSGKLSEPEGTPLEKDWKRANAYKPPDGGAFHVQPVPASFWKPEKPVYSLLNKRDGTRGGTATGNWDEIVARADKENLRMGEAERDRLARIEQQRAPGTDEYEKMRSRVAELEAKTNPSTEQEAFRDGVAMEAGRVGKEAHDYGKVVSGIANVLTSKGIKASLDKSYWKQSGSPLYWELADLFHSPLASMNPKMPLDSIARAMDSVLPTSATKIDDRGYKFKNSFDMGRPLSSMEKDLGKGGKFGQELESAERGAERMRRKADIVQALIGETENTKKARTAADNLEKDAESLRERAQGAIADAKASEAKTAKEQKERPVTLAKQVQPIENAKWTVKGAWIRNMVKAGEKTPWISDGHSAINLDLVPRKAANMAGERKFTSAKVDKLIEQDAKNPGIISAENMAKTLDYATKKSNSAGNIIGYLPAEALGEKNFAKAYIENSVSKQVISLNAQILRMVQDVVKPDSIKVGSRENAVTFYKGDNLAAVIMPLRTEPEIDVPTAKKVLAGEIKPEPAAEPTEENEGIVHQLLKDEAGFFEPSKITESVEELFKQDVQPALEKAGSSLTDTAGWFVSAVYPRIEESSFVGRKLGVAAPTDAVDALMKLKGDRARAMAEFDGIMHGLEKMFDRLPEEARINFIDSLQTGRKQATPELSQIADAVKKIQAQERAEEQTAANLGRKTTVNLPEKENYFHNRWETPPGKGKAEDEDTRISRLFTPRRPLEGSKSYNKQQSYTLKSGIAAGGKPVTTNPIRLLRLRLEDGMKFVTARRAWHELGELDLRQYVPKGERDPEGFEPIDDKIAKIYFPSELASGKTIVTEGGHWAVEANTARLLNNMLSKDLIRGNPAGRGLMWLKNASTALELGLSPFHAVFETIEAASSQLALGMLRSYNLGIREGDAHEFTTGLRQMLTAPVAPISMAREGAALPAYIESRARLEKIGISEFGHKQIEGKQPHGIMESLSHFREVRKQAGIQRLLKAYPDLDQLIDDMFTGGLIIGQHADYQTKMLGKTAMESWSAGNPIGALVRAVPTVTQGVMKPLFQWYIPNLKYSLFLRQMSEQAAENSKAIEDGTMTRAELARRVADSVENRFGELNFDNLFWNRTFKTALQFAFRSVTWRLGNVRELGGAAAGQAKEFGNWAWQAHKSFEGEKPGALPKLDMKASWLMSLIATTVGMGVIAAKILSKKYPWEWAEDEHAEDGSAAMAHALYLETIHPRTGEMDARDKPARISLPTYWKDVEHASSNPAQYVMGSLSSTLGKGIDLAHNEDYFGNYVYNPNASTTKKLEQAGKYMFPTPFSVSSYERSKSAAGSTTALLGAFGFPKAPSNLDFTPAEKKATAILKAREPRHTPEELAEWQAKREALDRGELSAKEARAYIKEQRLTWLEREVKQLKYGEALDVLDKANDAEKTLLTPIVQKKRANLLKQHKQAQVEQAEETAQ